MKTPNVFFFFENPFAGLSCFTEGHGIIVLMEVLAGLQNFHN